MRILLIVAIVCSGLFLSSCNNESATAEAAKSKVSNAANDLKTAANNTANAAADAVDPAQPTTTISFDKEEHDFGNINEGDKVEHIFKFTNTGNEPLIISSAKGSCGCTVPEWPKEPIPPGQGGEIAVAFDSKNKPGKQTKTVTIQANTDPNPTRLKIKADVAKDPNKPDPAASAGK